LASFCLKYPGGQNKGDAAGDQACDGTDNGGLLPATTTREHNVSHHKCDNRAKDTSDHCHGDGDVIARDEGPPRRASHIGQFLRGHICRAELRLREKPQEAMLMKAMPFVTADLSAPVDGA
jgi:hypothetical protein